MIRRAWLLIILHSLVAALPVVAALMMQYIVFQHRLPWGRAAAISAGIAVVLAIGIALTLRRPPGLRLLRFVTLVPVVLAVAAVLRLGAPALDATLSARPIALRRSAVWTTGRFPWRFCGCRARPNMVSISTAIRTLRVTKPETFPPANIC